MPTKEGRVLSEVNRAHLKAVRDSLESVSQHFRAAAKHHAAAAGHIQAGLAHLDAIRNGGDGPADSEGNTPLADVELSLDIGRMKRQLRLAELSLSDIKH
jgi:hypothetical protein